MTIRSRSTQARRALAVAVAALAVGSGLALPAHATVTMIMSAERNVGPDNRADGGVVGDPASRVRGFAGTGGIVGGRATAEAFPGQSMGPCAAPCNISRSGDVSETAASADADIGRLRGWSYASGNENAGSVLAGQSLRVGSQAVFGWVDPITVTSFVPTNLDLVLNMHASWDVNAPPNVIDSSYKREAVAVVSVSMAFQQFSCFGDDGCLWEDLGVLAFEGAASDFDGNHHQGFTWTIGAGGETGSGSSVNATRHLTLIDLSPLGEYRLVVEGTIGTNALGRASASVDFVNTGYIGLVGSYRSESGYSYPGAAIADPGNGVPTPPSLPLVLAGIALAAVVTTRPGRRGR